MRTPWYDRVRKGGKLTVYGDPLLEKGVWHGILELTLKELNTELTKNKINLQLESSPDAPTVTGGGANVSVKPVDGKYQAKYGDMKKTGELASRRTHGRGLPWASEDKKKGKGSMRMEQFHVLVPARPQHAPTHERGRAPKSATVGAPVLKVILAHELIHACGLDNDEHTDDDIFVGVPDIVRGENPDDDRFKVLHQSKVIITPPLILSQTVAKLKEIW